MDSVTQIALGAAVGEAVLGRRIGRQAALYGAVLGTLPDLDNFIPYGDPVGTFTYHRGFTHSLLMMALATPLVVWLIGRFHAQARDEPRRWMLMVYAVFATHALLDAFTVYGTQLLWPFHQPGMLDPVGWSSIFIIDPLYTLPLVVGLVALACCRRQGETGWRWNLAGLALSTVYLAWTLVAKQLVEAEARAAMAAHDLEGARLLTTPSPFNSLLWRVLIVEEGRYLEGYRSVFDGDAPIELSSYPRGRELASGLEAVPAAQRLFWFTKGYYRLERDQGVVLTDLRMGFEPRYIFRFRLTDDAGGPIRPEQLSSLRDLAGLSRVWDRIWDPEVVLTRDGATLDGP